MNITYDRTRGEVVAFGGFHYPDCPHCNETWVWNETTWQQLQPQPAPLGRLRAGFAYDEARGNAVLFGSPSQVHKLMNDTWVWDGQNWQEKHPPVSPPARWGLSGNILVYDAARQVIVLFGGAIPGYRNGAVGYLNDTWIWDGQTWTQINAEPAPPTPESSGEMYMAYDSANQVVVLVVNNTTWIWDGKTWDELHPTHTPRTDCNEGSAMGYDEQHHQIVFFCANLFANNRNDFKPYSETWLWDGKDWQQVKTTVRPYAKPYAGPGSEMKIVYDTNHQALILFYRGVFSAWAWTGDDWQQVY